MEVELLKNRMTHFFETHASKGQKGTKLCDKSRELVRRVHSASTDLCSIMSEVLPQFKDPSVLTSLLVGISSKSVRALCPLSDANDSVALKPLPKCKEVTVLHQTSIEKGKRLLQSVGPVICDKIRMEIHEMYRKGQRIVLSQFNELLKLKLKDDGYTLEKTSLWKLLRAIAFSYEKVSDRNYIFEKPELVRLRHTFLKRIKEYRDCGAYIVYTDETWIFEGMRCSKDWVDQKSSGGQL